MGWNFFLESAILGAGLAMDAFSASLANALKEPEMGFARGASDQVAFLSGGTVAELGTPGEIFETPKTEALRRFLRQ